MKIKKNFPLKKSTTFNVGGPARFFCEVKELVDIEKAFKFAASEDTKLFVLGGGSNIVFSDKGFDGLVMQIKNDEIKTLREEGENQVVRCGAGAALSRLVTYAAKQGLGGFEWAIGVPGTVGGAIRGNAGAFGSEMRDEIRAVRAIDLEKDNWHELVTILHDDCEFDYRESLFKKSDRYIIWDCEFVLGKDIEGKAKAKMLKYASKRKEKQPPLLEYPSAGSVFKNPVVSKEIREAFEEDKEIECKADKAPAGWLIERCDLKGKRVGDAMVSDKQANFIVNMGNATAEDIMILMSFVKTKVRNKYGVHLEEEIQIVV